MNSIAATPFDLRKRSAWMQNGQIAVEYIVIVGRGHFSTGSPASFQAR